MVDLILLTGIFVVLSGVLAMVDAAVLSVSHVEIEEMVMKRQWGSHALRAIHKHITRAVVVIVIATNIVNVLGPILVGQRAIDLFGNEIIGVITGVLAFLTIIFSEILPKSLGAHYAPFIGRMSAPVILGCIYILYPLVRALEIFARLFQSGRRVIGTEEQIRSLVTTGRKSGHIETDEGQLIHRAFILNDKTAADIMTPLKDVLFVLAHETPNEVVAKPMHKRVSRYPVFGKSMHDFLGIVMSQDLLEAIAEGKGDAPVTDLIREGVLVPAHQRSDELINVFREKHSHLAVVQENGKTVGVVTLEDVLEELVGDIEDEADIEHA